ncbi:MAG: hypothetical protein ACUVRV_11435 [Cyanobacteriota bacterium]
MEPALLESQQRLWGIVESYSLGIALIPLETEAKPHCPSADPVEDPGRIESPMVKFTI